MAAARAASAAWDKAARDLGQAGRGARRLGDFRQVASAREEGNRKADRREVEHSEADHREVQIQERGGRAASRLIVHVPGVFDPAVHGLAAAARRKVRGREVLGPEAPRSAAIDQKASAQAASRLTVLGRAGFPLVDRAARATTSATQGRGISLRAGPRLAGSRRGIRPRFVRSPADRRWAASASARRDRVAQKHRVPLRAVRLRARHDLLSQHQPVQHSVV